MDYFGEQATTVFSQGERRSRRKSRNKLRAYLYGSSSHDSSQSLSSDEDEERRNSLVGAARGARKRLSMTGSSIMLLSTAKGSTNYLANASTPNLLPSDPEEASHIAEQIKERARLDKIAAQNHVSSPVDEDKHVDSVMAPLRRKSLYTPGIATRHANDILRKPPPPQSIQSQADRDYYYNPAYPATSPLAQLAAMNGDNNGRDTPTQDVTHLGGLQLGTLRVTNGAASPVPQSTITIRQHQRLASDINSPDDFQTASEGSVADEGLTLMPPMPQNLAIKSSSTTVDLFAPMDEAIANSKDDEQEPEGKRTASPFQPQPSDHASRMANEYAAELGGFPLTNDEPSPIQESTFTDSRPFSYYETPSSFETAIPTLPDENVGTALSPPQETAAHSWRSMADEFEHIDAATGTREDAFSKLNGSLMSSKHIISTEAAANIDSAYSSRASLGFGQHAMTAASNIDSGYSSRASLGTGQHRIMTGDSSEELKPHQHPLRSHLVSGLREITPLPSKEEALHVVVDAPPKVRPSFTVIPQHALVKAGPSGTSTSTLQLINTARASARAPSQLLVKKLQKARPKSQPPPPVNAITVQGYRDLEQVHIPRVPSLVAAKHAERLVQFPLLDHTFPSSDHVNASRYSILSHMDGVAIRFPSPANTLESAAAGFTSAALSSEPTMMSPMESQNLIANEGDEWGPSSLVKSPSWSAFGGSKQKKLQKKAVKDRKEAERRQAKEEKELEKKLLKKSKELEKQKKRNESKERTGRSRRTSWYRGKSSERRSSERDAQATISDFGTVAESLGGSPYDIARPTRSPNYVPQQGSWHPHHLNTAMPRPRSTAALATGDAAGTPYAPGRLRSRSIGRPATPANEVYELGDGIRGRKIYARPQTMYADVPPVPAVPAVDLRQHHSEWAQGRRRSRSVTEAQESFHQCATFDFGEDISEVPRRPRSILVDAPPLPALPSSSQVEQLERETIKSRPQSMIVDSPVFPISCPPNLGSDPPAEVSTASLQLGEVPGPSMATPLALRIGPQREGQGTNLRPQSTIVGSSPSPISRPRSLKRDFLIEQTDSPQQLGGSLESDGTTPLRKARTSQVAVPDLWTSGSLEKKSPKKDTSLKQPTELSNLADQHESQDSSYYGWEPQRQAWSERRKSAGEALLTQNQLKDIVDPEAAPTIAALGRKPRPESTITRSVAANAIPPKTKSSRPVSNPPTSSTADTASTDPHKGPLVQQPGPEPCENPHRVFPTPAERRRDQGKSHKSSRKRVGSATSTPRGTSQNRSSVLVPDHSGPISASIDADVPTTSNPLIQRYAGGLLYGYEPGQGLGGSAGTRDAQTLATRKSVELSKGYGIDLSDVPVFIVPATH